MATRAAMKWSRAFNVWRNRLGLRHWTIVSVVDNYDDLGDPPTRQADSPGIGPGGRAKMVAATMYARPHYRQGRVEVSREWVTGVDSEELDDVARHEAFHMVISPLQVVCSAAIEALPKGERKGFEEWAARAVEEVTTHLEAVTGQADWSKVK